MRCCLFLLLSLVLSGAALAQTLTPEGSVVPSTTQTPNYMATQGVYTYLTEQGATAGSIVVLNTATNTPVVLTTYAMPCASPNGIILSGSYAYVTCYDTGALYVLSIDTTNPASPVLAQVGSLSGLQGPFPGITMAGTHVYVASHVPANQGAIYRIDVSDPATPVVDGSVATTPSISPNAVFVSGDYLYCACSSEPTTSYFEIFSANGTMTSVGEVAVAHSPQRLVVSGNYAYVTYYDAQTMDVIDITTPSAPVIAATLPLGCYALPIVLSGSYAYVGCYSPNGVARIDISTPLTPTLVGETATLASPVQALSLNGSYLLAVSGVTGGDFTAFNIAGAAQSIWSANGSSVSAVHTDGSVHVNPLNSGGLGIAIDSAGDVWSANGSSVAEFSSSGSILSSGYSAGSANTPVALAVDGLGSVWTADSNGAVSELSNSGTLLSPSTGYTGGGLNSPGGISIDISGNVWVTNAAGNSVSEIIGGAAPASPIVTGVQSNMLGVRP